MLATQQPVTTHTLCHHVIVSPRAGCAVRAVYTERARRTALAGEHTTVQAAYLATPPPFAR